MQSQRSGLAGPLDLNYGGGEGAEQQVRGRETLMKTNEGPAKLMARERGRKGEERERERAKRPELKSGCAMADNFFPHVMF